MLLKETTVEKRFLEKFKQFLDIWLCASNCDPLFPCKTPNTASWYRGAICLRYLKLYLTDGARVPAC